MKLFSRNCFRGRGGEDPGSRQAVKLGPAIRKSLRLRVKEGKASFVLPGERFSSDSNEGREFVQRHPALRKDRDYNRANPGITLVELTP